MELKSRSEVVHSESSASPRDEAADQERPDTAQHGLPTEGTPEFHERCQRAMDAVCQKYAYTAQQAGIVLRRNPLKLAPLSDYVFNRINRAEHGFRYYDKGGRKRLWYPDLEKVFSQYYEPQYHDDGYDGAFVIAERIEFMPGKPEIAHDADGCRVLNLWRPAPWAVDEQLKEPSVFLEHLAYILDKDETAIEHVIL